MPSIPKFVHVAVIGVVVLVAVIFQFGYPLLILLADAAAILGVVAIVVLTALDLMAQKKPARAARAATNAATQAA
jgi:purine-cytosine permease-like protein